MNVEANTVYMDILESFRNARTTGIPTAPPSHSYPSLSFEEAYLLNRMALEEALAAGEIHVGYKVGMTAASLQKTMNVTEPIYGPILASLAFEKDSTLPMTGMFQPKVECEAAFHIAKPLPANCTARDVLECTDYVCAAFEIVDSRMVGKNLAQDTVADRTATCGYILSDLHLSPKEVDLAELNVVLNKNGALLAQGTGRDVLGAPANSVAWLVNQLRRRGYELEPGSIVLTGAYCNANPAASGDLFEADFGPMGKLSVRFA